MIEPEFNLLDEGWIPVIYCDGTVKEISLTEALCDAHMIRAVKGDIPPQDAVLIRLMLAVLYSVYTKTDADGCSSEITDKHNAYGRWRNIWDEKQFDWNVIGKYLSEHHDRFYLFHPDKPFFQVNISKGSRYSASKLNGSISESANKPRLFSTSSGRSKSCLSYPEASRWLLFLNSFDDASLKPTNRACSNKTDTEESEDRTDGKLPSPGVGWVGKLGFVMVVGNNLFETLMLNLVLTDEFGEPFPTGKPIWEQERVNDTERVMIPLPQSPAELLTLQSRRILLERENEMVVGYTILGGDIVPRENALTEQMTMWRLTKENEWVPRTHDPSRAMWRDYSSLVMRSADARPDIREPGVIRWVSDLIDEGILELSMLNVHSTGICYDSKNCSIEDIVDDSISVNAAVLASLGESMNERINSTISKTDDCVRVLGNLASDLAIMNGLDKDRAGVESSKARRRGYQALDQPFRSWLASIDPFGGNAEACFNEWDCIIERNLVREAEEIIRNTGTRAMLGDVDKNGKVRNGFTAFRLFRWNLKKKLDGDGQ